MRPVGQEHKQAGQLAVATLTSPCTRHPLAGSRAKGVFTRSDLDPTWLFVDLKSIEELAEGTDTLADIVGVDVECKSENQVPKGEEIRQRSEKGEETRQNVHSKTHAALEVVRLAILNQQGDDQSRNKERDGLESLEVQGHLDTHDPAQDDQEGSDEKGDLQAATDRNTDRKIHLILVSHHDGSDMLCGVADDRDQHQTYERLAHAGLLHDTVNAADQVIGANGHQNGDDDQCHGGSPRAEEALFLFLLFTTCVLGIAAVALLEQLCVGAQLEVKVHNVEHEQDDGRTVRQDEDVGLGILLGLGKGGVEGSGDDQGRRCDRHQRGHGGCHGAVEGLLGESEAADEEAAAQNQENVGENTAQHTGLDHADLVVLERDDADLLIPIVSDESRTSSETLQSAPPHFQTSRSSDHRGPGPW